MADIGWFHDDTHWKNILVDLNTKQCYVIDFGRVWNINEQKGRVMCHTIKCSPYVHYYLKGLRKRNKLIQSYRNGSIHNHSITNIAQSDKQIIHEYSTKHVNYTVIAMLLKALSNAIVDNMSLGNQRMLFLIKINGLKESKHFENTWCNRYKLLSHLKCFKQQMVTVSNDERIINSFFDLLNVFDIDTQFIDTNKCKLHPSTVCES